MQLQAHSCDGESFTRKCRNGTHFYLHPPCSGMSNKCMSGVPIPASVVNAEAVCEDPFVVSIDVKDLAWKGGTYSGRIILKLARMSEYLPPDWPNQPDSGDRRRGQKSHLDCHQFDYTCGFVANSFAASVDVTGAVWEYFQFRSGRSHRRRFAHHDAEFGVLDRTCMANARQNVIQSNPRSQACVTDTQSTYCPLSV